jgi:monovalent cation/proton antiporter MnhG/PhaG subunit
VSAHEVAVHALIWVAVATELVCCVGVVVARGVYARLHYSGAAATLGPVLIAVAIAVEEGVRSTAAAAALVVAAFLLLVTPAVTAATARAARRRLLGRVDASDNEAKARV